MGIKFPNLVTALLLAGASTAMTISVQAQDESVIFRPREMPAEAMNQAFFQNSRSMLDQTDTARALQSWFGIYPFPENAIRRDAKAVNNLYNYLLERQVGDDPVIRTADLANPFDTSVQMLPTGAATVVNGNEFIFERPPEISAPMPMPPVLPPAPIEAKF